MKQFDFGYSIKCFFSNCRIIQRLIVRAEIIFEALFSKPSGTIATETVSFKRVEAIPEISLCIAAGYRTNKMGFNNLKLSLIDFSKLSVKSWIVASPQTTRMNSLYNRCVKGYNPRYLITRIPFTGIGKPHCFQISKSGYFVSTNGFFTYFVNTATDQVKIFPHDFLEKEPKFYASQSCFSPDGQYWYFVRWTLSDWVNSINGKKDTVRCEIGSVRLSDQNEEIFAEFDYIDNIHEIACSLDGRYLVFCSLKSEPYLPYPKQSYYRFPKGYLASHKAGGIKPQKIATFDLHTKKCWFSEVPVPTSSHIVFDPGESDVFYISAHNLVFHHLSVFIEGEASLFKMRISDSCTVIEKSYTDAELYRIFQHDVFIYKGETYLAVMSYTNKLFILYAKDMTLYKKVEVGPPIQLDFSKTGNILTKENPDIFFSVNASSDGRYIVLGTSGYFCAYDLEEEKLISLKNAMLDVGMGLAHTRPYGR